MKTTLTLSFLTLTAIGLTACGDADGDCVTVDTVDDASDPAYHDFLPADITIAAGDCVTFVMTATHNAIEVSEETYTNREIDALDGGFAVAYGETQTVVFDEPGTHYYVCQPHVTMDMIGTITVE